MLNTMAVLAPGSGGVFVGAAGVLRDAPVRRRRCCGGVAPEWDYESSLLPGDAARMQDLRVALAERYSAGNPGTLFPCVEPLIQRIRHSCRA